MLLWLVPLIVFGLILVYGIIIYNRLIVYENRINNSWSQIDVQLKRRADLIPNLIQTVKGYVKHEKGVLTEITRARSALTKAQDIKSKANAENMLEGALKSLFAVTENYPQLKANENFKMLQEELSGTENKIAYARQFFNDTVLAFNNLVEKFPSNIIANMFNKKEKDMFKVAEQERKNVKVAF